MAKKNNKWETTSNKETKKNERFSPAREQKPVETPQKTTEDNNRNNNEVKNISNITINEPTVIRYGEKKDTRTSIYNVNIRKEPSLNAEIIRTLPAGEEIIVLSVDGDWAKINEGEYVMAKYFN